MRPLLFCCVLAIGCERERRTFVGTPHYEETAWAASEGKRHFTWFNCVGCHSQGGGGMGVALMDSWWLYGSDPQSIYTSIMEGRPNGMPAFKNHITPQQAWQLVTYVRSLGQLLRLDVEQNRGDELSGRPSDFMLKHRGTE
jgi:cytochrome c oxidase cbb3-type subunit 3